MVEQLAIDRFDYVRNLGRAGGYRRHRGPFWPPADGYEVCCLDLGASAPDFGAGFLAELAGLKSAIEAEWERTKDYGVPARRRFNDPAPIAEAMRGVGKYLPGDADRRAITLRASAVRDGYSDEILQELAGLAEEVTIVAGQVSTWFGKEVKGLPTAFACRRDDIGQSLVTAALADRDEVETYLRSLHADLRLGDVPAFGAAQLFFIAGEGNLHPKHIAYFLPEDEGVKYSPFKKTYYFGNAHRALLAAASQPLFSRFTRLGTVFDPAQPRFAGIPTLGVLSHEAGHFVHRPEASFKELNAADRWVSVVLQETAADVFGILILAEVWAARLGIPPVDVITYYLAECLRYANRGLGHFPDSDGMYLQLSYCVQLGALALEQDAEPVLAGEPEVVLAALRSLARVLADVLLNGRADAALHFHRAFGPPTAAPLAPLVDALRRRPAPSAEYTQEYLYVTSGT